MRGQQGTRDRRHRRWELVFDTSLVPPHGSTIDAFYADWNGPRQPEEDIFATGDPEVIAASVELFCAQSLGSPIEDCEFFASGVLSVHGLRLADGRRVVVKAARRSFGATFLAAVQTVQAHLASRDFPCPKPMLGPTALERGIAVVEELLDRGARADAHDPYVTRQMAVTLARQVDLSRRFVWLYGLKPSLLSSPTPDTLWPEPHEARFDFVASAGGAEWIDELAWSARKRLADITGGRIVAHADWRAEHVRFEGQEIVSTYDWQSLAVGSEPALLGQIGYGFTTDWSTDQPRQTPTIEEFRGFIAEYEAARGRRFSPTERETIDAAWVYATAYGARCEHSDLVLSMPWASAEPTQDSYRGLLAQHARSMLGTCS